MGCAGSKTEKENKTQPTLNHANVPVNTPPIDHHPIKQSPAIYQPQQKVIEERSYNKVSLEQHHRPQQRVFEERYPEAQRPPSQDHHQPHSAVKSQIRQSNGQHPSHVDPHLGQHSGIKGTHQHEKQGEKNIYLTNKLHPHATAGVIQHPSHIIGQNPSQTYNAGSGIVYELGGSAIHEHNSHIDHTKKSLLAPVSEERQKSVVRPGSFDSQMDVVHDEGVCNFNLPVKNLNLQIEIM